MDIRKAAELAREASIWYHTNNIDDTSLFIASGSTQHSSDLWARLLAEAVMAFHNGLENHGDMPDHAATKALHDRAVCMVGRDAFETIAMVVSAAGTQRPIEQELDTAVDQMQQNPGTTNSFVDPQSFLPAIDLSGYLVNQADQQAYGQFSSWLMNVSSQAITQGAMHQATKFLQDLSKTQGLSQGFAFVLSSMGTEYQMLADKYTRQSGEGTFQGGGLPTGVQIQGKRQTIADFVIQAFKSVQEQFGIA